MANLTIKGVNEDLVFALKMKAAREHTNVRKLILDGIALILAAEGEEG